MNEVVSAKVDQAVRLLREFDLPVWIVQFGRETYEHPEPVQQLAVGMSVTWPAAFIVTAEGRKTAIVGTGDVANARAIGVYDVIGYVKDIAPSLLAVLAEIDPSRLGVSFSAGDDSADNITHGMFLVLQQCLQGTPYADRIVSAEQVVAALRARKLPVEVDRIRGAIETTLELFAGIDRLLVPGSTEREIADHVHRELARKALTTAWDREYDPVVSFGPASSFGHAAPGDIRLEPGMLVHVDLGVKQDGYCSDLQRVWYLLREGEDGPPVDVQRAFDTLVRSMSEGFQALRPGVPGWQVDAAARRVIVDSGYDEPEFSLGHQLGQTTHDGGGLLGPRWPRYGHRPEIPVEVGNVFTLEYALRTSAGAIGLEEDVVITEEGAEYLSPPQTQLVLLRR